MFKLKLVLNISFSSPFLVEIFCTFCVLGAGKQLLYSQFINCTCCVNRILSEDVKLVFTSAQKESTAQLSWKTDTLNAHLIKTGAAEEGSFIFYSTGPADQGPSSSPYLQETNFLF